MRIGFIPLTDCSSVVTAAVKGFDKKYGIKSIPTKEASWAAVRDKLVSGEIDIAHCLYGLVYGVHLGVGGNKKDMAVLMTLNHHGQAITLSRKLAEAGVDKMGFTAVATQDIWKDHPEKVLATTSEFVAKHPNASRAEHLGGLYKALSGPTTAAVDASDLLRAQVVLAVSALDFSVREITVRRMVEVFEAKQDCSRGRSRPEPSSH